MTPKLKAEELVIKFTPYSNFPFTGEISPNQEEGIKNAIQCAIICVEEILWAKNNTRPSEKKFWEDVLEELKKMN